MWWSRKEHPRAGRKAQKMCGSKERVTMSLRVVVSQERCHRWRWLKILSQDHIKQCLFVVRREKMVKEWNEQKLPKVLPGDSGGKLPGKSTNQKGREEGR